MSITSHAAEAFGKSFLYTATSTGSLFLLLALTDGGTTVALSLAWMHSHWWPFLVAQVVAPALRAHAAANLYTPVPKP
jgi:hypothetical protein